MSRGAAPEKVRAVQLPIRVGDIVAQKYRIDDVLGHGGMGVVFSAEQTALRRPVALKVLLPEIGASASLRDRFLREAQLAASLRDEHVVQILDVGTLDTGEPYLVMERLDGLSLGDLSKKRGPLPIDEAIDYVLQACEALLEAHAKGIIHRDLKPANMFAVKRPNGSTLIKVLDFGLAKAVDGVFAAGDASLTATGMLAGSPHYAPPEQLRSLKFTDVRADVWAMGVVLYELLSRHRPFEGPDGVAGIIARVLVDPPTPLAGHRPDLSPSLVTIVHSCLEKDASRRPQTVLELMQKLRASGREDIGAASLDTLPLSASNPAEMKTLVLPVTTPTGEAAYLGAQADAEKTALLVPASSGPDNASSFESGTERPTTSEVVAKASNNRGRGVAAAFAVGVVVVSAAAALVGLRLSSSGEAADAETQATGLAPPSHDQIVPSTMPPPSAAPPTLAATGTGASAQPSATTAPSMPVPKAAAMRSPGPRPVPSTSETTRVAPPPAKTSDPTEKYE